MKNNKMLIGAIICIAVIVVGICVIWGNIILNKWTEPKFATGEFEGVFCVMDGTSYFSEEDFLTYRGLQVKKSDKVMEGFAHIEDMLDIVFEANPEVNTIYMQINPMQLWEEIKNKEKWNQYLEQYFREEMLERKDTTFEILLSYPQITYCAQMQEEELETFFEVYQSFVSAFEGMENVFVYYLGAEQWLNSNPDNYENVWKLNEAVEKHVFLSVFCDRKYVTNTALMEEKVSDLKAQIEEYKTTVYPNMEEYCIIFLGDSIIGNDRSTCSVPGVVAALTKATTINCAKSGSAATYDTNAKLSFLDVLEALISGNVQNIEDEEIAQGITMFKETYKSEKKLCIVLNYGLNDYFTGYPIAGEENPNDIYTYTGALKTGVERLQKEFPQAEVILMVPTYTALYDEGTQVMSERGAVLAEYREVVKQTAEELGIIYKDNFSDIPMNLANEAEYLTDGCHLNDWGKYVMGTQLVRFLEDIIVE